MDDIVQPKCRKWISDKKVLKNDFAMLVDEVGMLDKTVLLTELEMMIKVKSGQAKTLKELYENATSTSKFQNMGMGTTGAGAAIAIEEGQRNNEIGAPADSGLESQSQSQVSRVPDEEMPGTSRAAIQRDLLYKKVAETAAANAKSPFDGLTDDDAAKIVFEFACGDKLFTVEKKPPKKRKRGRKKKNQVAAEESQEEEEEREDEEGSKLDFELMESLITNEPDCRVSEDSDDNQDIMDLFSLYDPVDAKAVETLHESYCFPLTEQDFNLDDNENEEEYDGRVFDEFSDDSDWEGPRVPQFNNYLLAPAQSDDDDKTIATATAAAANVNPPPSPVVDKNEDDDECVEEGAKESEVTAEAVKAKELLQAEAEVKMAEEVSKAEAKVKMAEEVSKAETEVSKTEAEVKMANEELKVKVEAKRESETNNGLEITSKATRESEGNGETETRGRGRKKVSFGFKVETEEKPDVDEDYTLTPRRSKRQSLLKQKRQQEQELALVPVPVPPSPRKSLLKKPKMEIMALVPVQSGDMPAEEERLATPPPDPDIKIDVDKAPTTINPDGEVRPQSPTRFKDFIARSFEVTNAELESKHPENVQGLSKWFNVPPCHPQLNEMADKIKPSRSITPGVAFREQPIVKGASMPALVPPFTKEAMKILQTLDVFMTHSDDPSGFQWRSNNVQQQINHDLQNIAYQKRMVEQKYILDTLDPSLLVNKFRDMLIEVCVYKNNDPDDTLPDDVKIYHEPRLAYRIEVLGSHTIEDLMDTILCPMDVISTQEVEHPDDYVENEEHKLKNKRLAKMIVIDNKIYSMHDDNVDFAGTINKWARMSKIRKPIGPFYKGDVKTKFQDLTLRLGYPYLYIHLNNCEHIIVINKARMIEPNDEHCLESYPRIVKSGYVKKVYCRIDTENIARWAVVDYAEFPENPMFVCTSCLKEYCYTNEGDKRGSFLLYPFRQMQASTD